MTQITIEQAHKDGITVEWRGIRIESITLTRRKKAPYSVKGKDAHASYQVDAWPWMLVDVVGPPAQVSTHWVDCDCPDRSLPCPMAPASVPQGWAWNGDIWSGPEPLEPHTVVVDGLPGVWRVGGVRENGRERILYSLNVKGKRRHVGADTLLYNVITVEGSGQHQRAAR